MYMNGLIGFVDPLRTKILISNIKSTHFCILITSYQKVLDCIRIVCQMTRMTNKFFKVKSVGLPCLEPAGTMYNTRQPYFRS
jgi:hypothetical protein